MKQTVTQPIFLGFNLERMISKWRKQNGEAAFFYAKIGQFKAPSLLTEYKNNCFGGTSFNNFKISDNTTYIGYRCFESARLDENIHIEKCTHIDEEAFRNYSCSKRNIHLSSAIKFIGKNCFMGNEEVNLFIHSIYPPHLDEIPDLSSAKRIILHVPKGYSFIYKRSSCWNIFNEIKEMDFSDNIDIAQKELFYILKSIQNVDREYVKGIIEDISSDYTLIEEDDDYMNILDLIRFNRKFSPIIHQSLEMDVFRKCTTTFKLRLMKDVFRTMDLPLLSLNGKDNIFIDYNRYNRLFHQCITEGYQCNSSNDTYSNV